MVAVLSILVESNDVDFYHFGQEVDQENQERLEEMGITVYPCHKKIPEWKLFRARYDLGIFEFFHTAKWLMQTYKRLQPWSTVVVDSVDVHFARFEMASKLGVEKNIDLVKAKAEEISVYFSADYVGVITTEDESLLKKEGIENCFILPNIVPNVYRDFSTVRPPNVLFVGGFAHEPNVDAAKWLLYEIWPIVLEKFDKAKLDIVGKGLPVDLIERVEELDSVIYHGFVENLESIIESTAVSIAPLRYGAGMKGKVNQAMASGLPVVSTDVGLQGIPGEDGVHFMKSNEANEFAKRIADLLCSVDLQNRMGKSGQSISGEICGIELSRNIINNLLRESINRNDQRRISIYENIIRYYTFVVRVIGKSIKSLVR